MLIKTKEMIESLINILAHLNNIHEYHILKLVGEQKIMETLDIFFKGSGNNFLKTRIERYL